MDVSIVAIHYKSPSPIQINNIIVYGKLAALVLLFDLETYLRHLGLSGHILQASMA